MYNHITSANTPCILPSQWK
jgi:hypothetical protein